MTEKTPVEFNPGRTSSKKEIRPWGSFEVLLSGPGFQVKRITVKPLQRLSLQWHRHRDEQWVVARGTARVTVDNKETVIGRGQMMNVPRTVRHRIENISSVDPVEIIEVQTGEYLDEDDIVRLEDDYGRAREVSI